MDADDQLFATADIDRAINPNLKPLWDGIL
jgi:hypothetical protein